MTAIASTDLTFTIMDKDSTRRGRRVNLVRVLFGNAALTYPVTGVPLGDKENLGIYQTILRVIVCEKPVNGYDYIYDATNHSIRIQQSAAQAAHTHNLLVIGGVTADEDVGVLASGPTLGKLAATNRTILGVDSATKGGVVSGAAVAAAPMSEVPTSYAPASTTLLLEVKGV